MERKTSLFLSINRLEGALKLWLMVLYIDRCMVLSPLSFNF